MVTTKKDLSKQLKSKAKARSKKPRIEVTKKICPECDGLGFKEFIGGLIQKECPACLGLKKVVIVKDSSGHILTGEDRRKIIKESKFNQ